MEAIPDAPNLQSKIQANNMFGGSIELSWENLTLRSAYNKAVWDLNLGEQIQFGNREYEVMSFGFKADVGNVHILAEYASTRDLDEEKYLKKAEELQDESIEAAQSGNAAIAQASAAQAALLKTRLGGSKAYYLTTGYQVQSFLIHLTAADLKKPYQDDLSGDQKSITAGVNYDIDTKAVAKIDIKKIYVPEGSQGLFGSNPHKDGSDVEATIYSIGYNLVF